MATVKPLYFSSAGRITATQDGDTFNQNLIPGSVIVDWLFDEEMAAALINTGASTVNWSTDQTPYTPTQGETIVMYGSTFPGIWVLGSVATLSAIPLTRHPAWPTSRELVPGLEIIARTAPDILRDTMGYVIVNTGMITPADDYIQLESFVPNQLVKLIMDSGATMPSPLVDGNTYFLSSSALSDGRRTLRVSQFGSDVNITSTGVNSGGGNVMTVVGIPHLTDRIAAKLVFNPQNPATSGPAGITFGTSDLWTRLRLVSGSRVDGPSGTEVWFGDGQKSHSMGGAPTIGFNSKTTFNSAIAIGSGATGLKQNSIAIGAGANSNYDESVALGKNAATQRPNEFALTIPARGALDITGLFAGPTSIGAHRRIRLTLSPESSAQGSLTSGSFDYPGVYFRGDSALFIKGRIFCQMLDGTKSAEWEVRGFASQIGGPANRDVLISRVSSIGDTSAWKVTTYAVPPSFEFLVNSEAGSTWWADIETDDAYDPFASSWTASTPNYLSKEIVMVTTSEALTAGNLINLHDSSGVKARKANASTGAPAHGFVLESYSSSTVATVYRYGENPFISSLTVGPLYLSTTAGAVTSTPPSSTNVVQRIGFAISSSRYIVSIEPPQQIAVGTTAPANPAVNQLWLDTN